MISRVVLGDILKVPVIDVQENLYKNRVYYKVYDDKRPFGEGIRHINVHELVAIGKQWAVNFDECIIETGLECAKLWTRQMCGDDEGIIFIEDTEHEAAFKAFQHVLIK